MQKAISGIREAAAKGAQIVCLQELFTSLYFCDVEDHENFKLAEAIPGHRQILYLLLPKNWA
jgi:N-carbamoylputrescine amidase